MKKKSLNFSVDSSLYILTAVSIGGALEWFEVGMFIAWPLIIQKSTVTLDALLASFNVGAVLSVVIYVMAAGGARALGGWFFGRKGDLQGRKVAFPLTILMSTIPSCGLVFLSFFISYDTWITYSAVIITLIKVFQGIPAGGEIPGAICYLAETNEISQKSSRWDNQRFMCSFALFGPQIGLALSILVCLALKFFFSHEVLIEHGWKYVFLITALMGIAAFCMRKKLHETVAFTKRENRKIAHGIAFSPVKTVFGGYKSQLGFGSTLPIFEVVSFSVLSAIPLCYSIAPFNLPPDKIIFISLGSYALCVVFLPLIGYLSSKHTGFPWLNVSAWGVILLSPFLYRSLVQGDLLVSLIINIVMIFLFSVHASILPSLLANLFPVQVRYTGIAFSFNICDGILWTIITGICFHSLLNSSSFFIFFLPVAGGIFLIIHKWFKTIHRATAKDFM